MFPQQAGDEVLVGIVTWDDDTSVYRYFVPAQVVANDRQAGVLVLEYGDAQGSGRLDIHVYSQAEGGFEGEELAPNDPRYPRTKAAARELHLAGTHPDQLASEPQLECPGHPAGPYDAMGETAYCDGSCIAPRA